MASNPAPKSAASRETLWAIVGSFLISLVLASVVAGNPFRALSHAYGDYGHTGEAPAAPK